MKNHGVLLLRAMRQCRMLFRMSPTENLIGTAEVARMLGKSHRTVHRLVQAGTLKPALVAPGGRKGAYLFNRAEVEKLAGAAA